MPDNDADAVLDRDQSDRMARMAQRLAAAGPRTRQRVLERHGDLRGLDPEPRGGWWPRVAADDRQASPAGEHEHIAAAASDGAGILDAVSWRHFAWLSVAAVLGFGAVAVGQSPRLAALLRDASRRADTGRGTVAESAPAISQSGPAQADQETAPLAPAAPTPASDAAAAPPGKAIAPAPADTADDRSAAATVDAPQTHMSAARIVRPPLLAKAPHLQRAAAFVAVPHRDSTARRPIALRPIHRVAAAPSRPASLPHRPAPPHQAVRYVLPRWLTDQPPPQPAPARPMIMSPPPQMLAVPKYYPEASQ